MKKLLVIEDDKLIGRVYACRFELERFEVKLVEDGAAGMAVIPEFKPDAVVVDLMIPKVSGFEVLRRIRAQAATRDLPVIVFSNAYLSSIEKDAMELGATLCLHKGSTTPQQMVEAINRVLVAPVQPALPVHRPGTVAAASEPPDAPERAADSADVSVVRLRNEFFERAPSQVAELKKMAQGILSGTDPIKRAALIGEMYGSLRALTSNADLLEVRTVSRLASAMEALLKELQDSPENMNASSVRTISQGVDFIGQLLSPQVRQLALEYPASPQILVVDDDAVSRKVVTWSLEKGHLTSTDVEDPLEAEELVSKQSYDLIILDVQMPGMNGFELCQKLRVLPGYAHTPIIFVTALSGFESRKNAAVSGGDDFIAKPFLFLELTVKALIHLLRNKVEKASSESRGFIPRR